MNNYIGIRVTHKKIFYTIAIEGKYYNDVIIVPQKLETPRQLSYIRTVLQSIITEQGVTVAGLRLCESIASAKTERIYIEGVIQEFFANSSIEKYSIFRLRNMAKRNGVSLGEIQEYIQGENTPEHVEGWKKFSKEHRESFLVVQALMKDGNIL